MAGTRIVSVSSVSQLQSAMGNLQAGDTIVLANGTYNLTSTLYVNGRDNVTIRGNSGCDQVVLVGRGMDNPSYGSVPHGVWSNAQSTTIAHLTIRDTYDNTIIFNGGAQSPHVYQVKLVNAGSQFIKANPLNATEGVDNGVVEYSIMEYTAGPPTTDHGRLYQWLERAHRRQLGHPSQPVQKLPYARHCGALVESCRLDVESLDQYAD
jgi:hypothetical protein